MPIEQTNSKFLQTFAKFERSISGENAFTTLDCSCLPFITMDVILPCSYPSENKPIYQIRSNWLNLHQLDLLSNKLEEIWNDNCNTPILNKWIVWLENNFVKYLEISESDTLLITPLDIAPFKIKNKNILSMFFNSEKFMFDFVLDYHFKRNKNNSRSLNSELRGVDLFDIECADDEQLREKSLECPSCKQINLKFVNNNHMKCWKCSIHYCFCCRKSFTNVLDGDHFKMNMRCKHYS